MEENEDSVSRAYYAMFFAAMAALATVDSHPRTHKGVSAEFNRFFVKTGRLPVQLSKDLEEARSHREESDYAPGSDIPRAEAEEMLEKAKVFVETVRKSIVETDG